MYNNPGLEIRGWLAAVSNLSREPKDVLVSIHNTFRKILNMQLGSPEKSLISSPEICVVFAII